MLKALKWFVVPGLLGGIIWFLYEWFSSREAITADAWSLIPSGAVYCIATEDPIGTWKDISDSETWLHLRKNSWFAALTESANKLDSVIRDNDLLTDLIGTRPLIISAHMTGFKQYDFLFMVDLGDASGIKFLNDYFSTFTTRGISINTEKYGASNMITVHDASDNSNLYVGMPGNYLVASFNRKILTSSLEAAHASDSLRNQNFIRTANELPGRGSIRFFLNYSMLPAFVNCYTNGSNEYITRLSQTLNTTAFNVSLQDEMLRAEGHTFLNDSVESYIRTLTLSGAGPTDFAAIAPQRTAMAVSLGFRSFSEFFSNFEKNVQQDVTEYKAYRSNLKEIETYLEISVEEHLISWIGDEVALLEMQSSGPGGEQETALVLKASDIEKAKSSLAHIEKMIRKKTPVKFKAVDHRGYAINYLSMKGIFKVLLGKFFARYDKPYFTIVNNFVIFSNHPQTLQSIIDDYLDGSTLNKSAEFRDFRSEFGEEGSAFVYLNTPVAFKSMKKLVDGKTQVSMEKNRDFIVCFRQIGLQFVPASSGFRTLMLEKFSTDDTDALLQLQLPRSASADSVHVTLEADTSEHFVEVAETDPMELPYIYPKDVNAQEYTSHFPDSTVNYTVELRNGFKHGVFTEFYSNGEVKMKGHFKNDKREGTWRLFDERGTLLMKREYENGEVTREKTKE